MQLTIWGGSLINRSLPKNGAQKRIINYWLLKQPKIDFSFDESHIHQNFRQRTI